MPIPSQIIEVPFARGQDEKTDPRWVQTGTETSVVNGSFAKNGSLRKRAGSTAISKTPIGGAALTAGAAVETYKFNPVVSDGSSLYTYDAGSSKLVYADQLPECIALRTPIAQSTAGVISADCAAVNGYAAYVYRATDVSGTAKNYATVVNLATGAQIGANTVLDTSTKNGLRCFSLGTKLWAVWTNSSGVITASSFDTSIPSSGWAASTPLASDVSGTATVGAWDVCAVSGGTTFLLVYQDNEATNKIKVALFTSSATLSTSVSFAIGGGSLPVTSFGLRATSGETAWVAYTTTDGATHVYVRCTGLNPATLATTVADTLLWTDTPISTRHIGVERVSSAVCVVVSSGSAKDVSWQQFNTSASLVGGQRTLPGWQMWSRPVAIGSKIYFMAWRYGDATSQTFEMVDAIVSYTGPQAGAPRARPVATVAARIASQISSADQLVSPSIASIGNSQYIVPVTVQQSTTRVGAYQCLLDFASPQRHQSVELGDCMYVAGGVPMCFGGAQATEIGMIYPPLLGTVVVNAGGSVDVGQHQYAVVFKWPNERGELVRSAPAYTGQVTTSAGNQSVSIQVPPLALTTKQDEANGFTPAVTFDLYRNTIADPATFWQVTPDSSEIASDPRTSGSVTLTADTINDATLTGNAYGILYTDGGVLSSQCPPSMTCLTVHKNRLVGAGDDGTTLYFSQQYVPGFQPAFNDLLTLACPDGGTITGLKSVDDYLVVWKQDRIFKLFGTGWNNAGQNSDFSDFVRVASDTGCTSSRSIVVAPQGAYFLSPQGIYLLTRAGEVVYAGKAVEDTVAANPICFASAIDPTRGEIRWSLAPTLTSATGVTVVYDYIADAWSVHKYYDTDKALANAVMVGAAAPGGTWCTLGAGGQLFVESTTSYLDGGSQFVGRQWITAWLKANGIGGWARWRRFFLSMTTGTPCQIKIEIAVDFSDTYSQSMTFSDATIATWTDAQWEAVVQVANQKSQAIRFRVTELAPATLAVGTGQGPTAILGQNCEVAAMPGSKGTRTPSGQRG